MSKKKKKTKSKKKETPIIQSKALIKIEARGKKNRKAIEDFLRYVSDIEGKVASMNNTVKELEKEIILLKTEVNSLNKNMTPEIKLLLPDPSSPKKRKYTKSKVTLNRPEGADDLKQIIGLGAKIESLMYEAGITTYAKLAGSTQKVIKGVLEKCGPRFKNQNPLPLISQAKLIKAGKIKELELYQAELMKGKSKPGPKPNV